MYSVIYFSQVDDGENYENIQLFFLLILKVDTHLFGSNCEHNVESFQLL